MAKIRVYKLAEELKIDKERIKQDAQAAAEKARELTDQRKNQSEDLPGEEDASTSE